MMFKAEQPEAAPRSCSLIDISPKKDTARPVSPKTTDLLVDIETEASSPKGRVRHTETFSYAAAVTPKKTEGKMPTFNLLD